MATLSALQLKLTWGLWLYGVGVVGTIWHQSSASHICSFVLSPASLCPPAATTDTLPAASYFPGKLSGCLQPSCLLLPATKLLLQLPRRLLPLKHGLQHTGNPSIYGEPQYSVAKTNIRYIELRGDVWGWIDTGVRADIFFLIFSSGKCSKLQHTADIYNCTLQKAANTNEERITDGVSRNDALQK